MKETLDKYNYKIKDNSIECMKGNCNDYQEILEDILDLFYKQIQ